MTLRMAAQLVPLKDVERLSPLVVRVLGGNPSKYTLQGTNTYLIGRGKNRILLDTGEGEKAWLSSLKSVVSSESVNITTALLTHWHQDHIQGVPDLLSIFPSVKIHKFNPSYKGDSSWAEISDRQKFTTEGATLRAFHCPGHTEDHMAFVLEEENAMFSGDNVLGQGTAVFEDLKTYMESLEGMQKEFDGRIYPAHGPLIEQGKAMIKEYIDHRRDRERQILDVLASNNSGRNNGNQWSSMDIVKVVYKDYPENLHIPAEGGVIQVLQKLEKEGKVAQQDDDDNAWLLKNSSNL